MSSSVGSPPVSGSRRTSARRSAKPSAASRCATARPIPEDEPVTMAQRGIGSKYPKQPLGWDTRRDAVPGVACVAHCLLNQNAKTIGGARCPGIYSPLVDVLRKKGWRIEQMPCPELAFTGLNRFWAVREQYDTAAFRRHCQRLASAVVGAIEVHVKEGRAGVVVGLE